MDSGLRIYEGTHKFQNFTSAYIYIHTHIPIHIYMQVDSGLAKHPGIFLGGNYVCGVAFGSCVEWGLDTAPKIVEFLKTKAPAKEKVPA